MLTNYLSESMQQQEQQHYYSYHPQPEQHIISLHSSIHLGSPIHNLSRRSSSLHYWHLNSNTSPCSSWMCWPFLHKCAQCQQVSLVAVEGEYILQSLLQALYTYLCPAHQPQKCPLQLHLSFQPLCLDTTVTLPSLLDLQPPTSISFIMDIDNAALNTPDHVSRHPKDWPSSS